MDKEAFEKEYCENSDMTLEEYRESFVTLPCKCDYEYCQGWACVSNTPLAIKAHNELYNK